MFDSGMNIVQIPRSGKQTYLTEETTNRIPLEETQSHEVSEATEVTPGFYPDHLELQDPQQLEELCLDPDEQEQLEQIRIEQDQRLRALGLKEQKEADEKRDKQHAAKLQLDDWYNHRNRDVTSRGKLSKEQEWAFMQSREDHKKSKNPWEKIMDNVEVTKSDIAGTKDMTRMKNAMLARKSDITKAKAGGGGLV